MEKYFLGFDDPCYEENFTRAKKFIPDIKQFVSTAGIHESHKMCGKNSLTNKFMVLDGDCFLVDNFSMTTVYNLTTEENVIYIFRSFNPVNNLMYGHGGVKIFDKRLFNDQNSVDLSTSFRGKIRVVKELTNIHRFNTSPFHAWRTAFRECVKLASGIIEDGNRTDDEYRLTAWCEVFNDVENVEFVKLGAIAGREYGHRGLELSNINNFKWLKREFENVLETRS